MVQLKMIDRSLQTKLWLEINGQMNFYVKFKKVIKFDLSFFLSF